MARTSGLDVAMLQAHVSEHGSVAGSPDAEQIGDREQFWGVNCDILIPAALKQQINESNAHLINAKLILKDANGPAIPVSDDVLRERGVLIVPDVIAYAGWDTISYSKWAQDFSICFWAEDEINLRLTRIMRGGFSPAWQLAGENNTSLRTAAFIVACTGILQARDMRGLNP